MCGKHVSVSQLPSLLVLREMSLHQRSIFEECTLPRFSHALTIQPASDSHSSRVSFRLSSCDGADADGAGVVGAAAGGSLPPQAADASARTAKRARTCMGLIPWSRD